ncbi:hypothetical protein BDR26DRAFT_864757 [Obelidium mucronatum]|nr:hypothetical protein BDR26DRAFT_864757 [Obelidium mucronatum]
MDASLSDQKQVSLLSSGSPTTDMQLLQDAVYSNFPLLNASDLLYLQPAELQQLSWDFMDASLSINQQQPYDNIFSTFGGEYESSSSSSASASSLSPLPVQQQQASMSPETIGMDPTVSAFFFNKSATGSTMSPIQTFTPMSTPTISPASLAASNTPTVVTKRNQHKAAAAAAAAISATRSSTPEENCATHTTTTTTATTTTVNGNKTKKMRFRATKQELEYLLHVFESNPFPSASQRKLISEKLQLEPKQVLFWFQNRRATLKSNGIVAVKPKKTAASGGGGGGSGGGGKEVALMEQLSAENPYFYVADKSALL